MIETAVATVEITNDDVVIIRFPKKEQIVLLENSKEILNARISFSPPGTKQLVLADLTTNPKPNREARDYAKSKEMNKSTKGLALLVTNGVSSILGNLFLGFNKGEYPVKLFLNQEDAIIWLKSL